MMLRFSNILFPRLMVGLLAALLAAPLALPAAAQEGRLRVVIDQGVIEPMPMALPAFIAESPAMAETARRIGQVVAADLVSSGIFREIPPAAHLTRVTSLDAPVAFADWKAINAQALLVGAVADAGGGRVTVKFRLWDVFAQAPLGDGLRLTGPADGWRRLAHKVADNVYERLTGETGYFDSQIAFISETGPKNARQTRLSVMDQDGAGLRTLTDGRDLVLAPRFAPDGGQVLYTSYASGFPRITVLDLGSGRTRALDAQSGTMSFAPRFAPDGRSVVFSLEQAGNTDLYRLDLRSGARTRLTSSPAIETAPSFSPDGRSIVFESDRSGSPQIYIMPASGGEARRISFGAGRYGTPVWSPRGDLIAFTKQNAGRFHIGVMRTDGSEERLLTAAFLDEGPSWAPNGRVLAFTREGAGARGERAIYTVDVTGRNLRRLDLPEGASDPAWSPLRR